MPEKCLMLRVAVCCVSLATFTWYVVLVRPSCRLVPVSEVVYTTTFQLCTHRYINQL